MWKLEVIRHPEFLFRTRTQINLRRNHIVRRPKWLEIFAVKMKAGPEGLKVKRKTIASMKPPSDFGNTELTTVDATKMAEHESHLGSFQGRFIGSRLSS